MRAKQALKPSRTDATHDRNGTGPARVTMEPGGPEFQVFHGTEGPDVIDGWDSGDEIYGYGGDDVLHGRRGGDFIDGGSGNDQLYGDDGIDVLRGGLGDDYLSGGDPGHGDPRDIADYGDAPGAVVVNLALGTSAGAAGTDTLVGMGGVTGSAFDDTLIGNNRDNVLRGGLGDDTLDGGLGRDTADYSDASGTVRINLALNLNSGAAGSDNLISIENVTGSAHDDFLDGDGGANVLSGGGGSDRINGGGGADTLSAGAGVAYVDGLGITRYRGSILNGDAGDDWILGGSAEDVIDGGDGADRISGGEGDDQIQGGDGDDALDGGMGHDVVRGGGGADSFTDAGGVMTIYGDDGDDSFDVEVVTGSFLDGGGGFDRLTLASADLVVDLQAGTVTSAEGTMTITGIEGVAAGGTLGARLYGSGDSNVIRGTGGNDVLVGRGGFDALYGSHGYDVAGYAGARRNYTSVDSSRVEGGREGGADSLFEIEAAAFVDGLVTFDPGSQAAQLMRLYDTAFGRTPDDLGFHIQLDALEAGVTLLEMARRFLTSDEFVSRYGTLTDTQYIQRLYANALNREPSNGEINDWLVYLNAGFTRQDLMLRFSESPEHRAMDDMRAAVSAGLWVGNEVSESLARLYDSAFDRLPDEAGLITWRNALGHGSSLLDVATAFLASTEGQAMYGGLSNAQFVEKLYQTALNRTPDAGGMAAYTAGLDAGTITRAQMLVEVSESAEHRALTLPTWVGGIPTQETAGGMLTYDGDKDAGPQVLPGLAADDDAFLPMPAADAGREWAGLSARLEGDMARELPAFAAEDFLPVTLKDAGPQVLPAETGLDLDALFEASPAQLALEEAMTALTPDPLKPTALPVEDGWHQLPTHDAFQ